MARVNGGSVVAHSNVRTNLPRPTSPGSDSLNQSGSDKENRTRPSTAQKRKSDSRIMAPADTQGSATAKRRRIEMSQSQRRRTIDRDIDTRYYDPEQDPEERRRTKRGLRDLHTKLNDSRQEYLEAGSTGLLDTLRAADRHFANVKQTSDATVDSRLLVATADLSYKKINTLTLGDSSVGVDVDDFISKCIGFMKRANPGGEDAQPQTQRRMQQQADDDDDEDSGDTMNWSYLGRNACVLYNSRPCLSGFLLGPLSVQKKVRQQTQRRAREERGEPTQGSRTLNLTDEERNDEEKMSLTAICTEVLRIMSDTQRDGEAAVSAEYEAYEHDLSEEELNAMMWRNNMTSDGSIPLFKFCINPKSFGQTIENLFYVSFLIKEGRAGLGYDRQGLPTIGVAGERGLEERQEAQRNQAVFTMSFEIWEDIIEAFGIEKCILPHREEIQYEDGVLTDQRRENDDAEDSDMYG